MDIGAAFELTLERLAALANCSPEYEGNATRIFMLEHSHNLIVVVV